jgi:flagellar biosynthesis/type III secretory pathway protein FliH
MSAMDKLCDLRPEDWPEELIQEAAKEQRDSAFAQVRTPIGQGADSFERGMRKGWALGFEAALLHLKNGMP